MEGIQILYSEPVYVATSFSTVLILGGFLLAFILFIVDMLLYKYEEILKVTSMVCLIIGIVSAVLMAKNIPLFSKESSRKEYKCTISEDVSMIEFYDTYYIVEREGDLWTIQDK